MHNIKHIRENFDEFKKKIQNRNVNFDLDKLRNLDVKNRDIIFYHLFIDYRFI